MLSDAENLPFADASFDFVYSWGVIHHTEDVPRAASEIMRVLKPGGEMCVMVYHRHSLVSLQCWVMYGLLRGKPWRSFADVIWHHMESIGTRAYSVKEARHLFTGLSHVEVSPVVTTYDVRLTRRIRLPAWIQWLVPRQLGWFLVIKGTR
jgi:ubiquinone/menaquinone biosynthesis C-methylase UbiE